MFGVNLTTLFHLTPFPHLLLAQPSFDIIQWLICHRHLAYFFAPADFIADHTAWNQCSQLTLINECLLPQFVCLILSITDAAKPDYVATGSPMIQFQVQYNVFILSARYRPSTAFLR